MGGSDVSTMFIQCPQRVNNHVLSITGLKSASACHEEANSILTVYENGTFFIHEVSKDYE